jgi:hypothetical protein
MKARNWLLLMIVTIGAAGLLLARGQVGQKAEAGSDVGALRKQVERLQARLKSVEDRLAELESAKQHTVPHIEIVPNLPGVPKSGLIPAPTPNALNLLGPQPKIWRRGQINGWPFYLIPCATK